MAIRKVKENILDFAIRGEQEAVDFYTDLAKKMERPAMRQVFESFAKEEMGHKKKLEQIKDGGEFKNREGEVPDLKIADYIVEVEPEPGMDYRDALVVAMKKEKAAFKLYSDMAAMVEDSDLKETFLSLAQEEAKHKLRFELEYDEKVLSDN